MEKKVKLDEEYIQVCLQNFKKSSFDWAVLGQQQIGVSSEYLHSTEGWFLIHAQKLAGLID